MKSVHCDPKPIPSHSSIASPRVLVCAMDICKFLRLKWVLMGNNRGLCNNVVIIHNNDVIIEACRLHNM